MSAFSTGPLTPTNAPKKSDISGTFGSSTGLDADTILTTLSTLTTRLGELTQEFQELTEAVDEKLETKQDVLTFDTTPTPGSDNPVTSGGVYTALQELDTTLLVGTMLRWPYGASVPAKFHACDGSTYSTSTYPELFSVLASDTLPLEYGSIIKME